MENTDISDQPMNHERIESLFNTLNSTIGRIKIKAEKAGKQAGDFYLKLEESKTDVLQQQSEAKELLKADRFEELDHLLIKLEEKTMTLLELERNNYSEIYAGQ